MYNKKLLSKIDLGKFHKPNPYAKDIITDPAGQYNHPGQVTRIPSSNITMKGIDYPVLGVADNGQKQMMQPGQNYLFPGAKYVDEYPQMKKGGGLNSKKYTRSLEGIGSLFRESNLFKKPKSKKKKFFHPNAKYYQDGGLMTQDEIDGATEGMMKARLAYAQMHGNPAAQRMVVAPDQPYVFDDGDTGTHFMASMDNYAVPLIQDVNGQLMLGDFGPESAEAMRFDNPEDAMYFAENYKQITPDESYRKEYQMGGDTEPGNPKNPPLTAEQKEYLRIKRAEAKKVYDAAKAGDPDAKRLSAEFKVKYPGESWTCPSDNCPAPTKTQPTTKPKVNQYPTQYKPVVNNIPQTPPEGKAIVGYEENQQLDPKTGVVTTVKNPVYRDLEKPIPTLRPTRVDPRLIEFTGNPESEMETDEFSTYPTPDGGADWVGRTERYVDWDGRSVKYKVPRFRKPGHSGPLIKSPKTKYLHLPTIEKRYQAEIVPEEEEYAVGGVASPKDLDPETMRRYLAALKDQENNIKAGYKGGKWYPHKSPEGGLDTIAYGHKLTSKTGPYYQGITDQQAEQLLQGDVLKHQAIAKKQVDKKYGEGTFDNLPQDRQMLLVDYTYNLGTLSGFPSFVDATVKGDKDKMIKEHVRYGDGKPLKRRNDWTMSVINEMTMPKPYDPNTVEVTIANVPDATQVVNPVDPAAMPASQPAIAPPPPQFQGGGVVELDGYQFVKDPNGQFTYFDPVGNRTGAPVTDKALMQRLQYEAKPVGTKPVVQEAPGRQKAKETIVAASKNVKPQPIERNIPRANVSDATSVVQPYTQKPSFLDQPGPAKSLAQSQKLLQDEAQRLITSGAARDMGITTKYLSPQNANSANPKSLQQLMIEEMVKKDFQKRLDQSRLDKVNKKWNESSTLGKVGDVTRSFLADPINVAEEAIWGDQYLPDRANILRDPRNPLNPYYRKETGYDQSPINNMVNMINPFSSAADATVYARQGNLLGTATQFGEGLLKAAVLTRAPGLLNSAMSRTVNLGALGVTDLGTIAGATGVGAGITALPTTGKSWYKYSQTGKKEDLRDAVNQTAINATDFIAPELLGSKGALSALIKGEKLTPLQQLSRQNILPGGSIATPGLDNLSDIQNALRRYTDTQSEFPSFSGTLPSSSSASNVDDIINRVQQLRIEPVRLEPGPTPAPITRTAPRTAPRTVSPVQTDSELQDALTAARERIAALPDDTEERRMFEVFAAELRSSIDARNNYSSAILQLENAKRNHAAAGLQETNDLVMQAQADLVMAKENLKISDPDYLKINETARQSLNEARQRQLASNTPTGSIDLTRRTPGVTTYEGTNLPAVSSRSNLFEGALSNYNIANEPIKFSETTRTALNSRPPRQRGSGSLMTVGAQLRASSDPIEFANRLRNMQASGNIDVTAYKEISKNFRNILGQSPDAANILDFDYAKMILETDPKAIYTGSMLTRNEALNELNAIPDAELDAVLRANYGYSLDDTEFIFMNPDVPENAQKIAMNQIIDDYEHFVKYNTLNPHAPAIDFRSRQVLSPRLQNSVDELDLIGLSDKAAETIKKTTYKGSQNLTSGTVSYSGTARADLPKINNKDYIIDNNELTNQLDAYEEAFGKLQNNRGPVYNDIRNRVEDLRATKWLRTEYAAELRAARLDPKEIDKITVITTGSGSKSLVNADGDVIGTLNFGTNTYEGTKFSEISSTGVNLKFHGYSLKNSKFKTWEGAEKHLAKRYLDDALATITNPSDKKNPIVVKSLTKKANDRAAAEIAQMQVNNNNRFGEALYRGVHHGIKDTRGGIGTKEHFVDTNLPDPITGQSIIRKRAQDYWYSQIKQMNDKGIGKAGRVQGPLTENNAAWGVESPIFVLRKLGGDVSKLSRFIR